jgi:beta-lactamase regulating signal transducer with metallopeptidase domain
LLFATLCGWALVEPASAERVPNGLLWGALPFAAIVARAVWRAGRAQRSAHTDQTIVTVGFLQPRIVFSARIAEVLDAPALAAALAHEEAHVRHRDPLRLWLAQLGSDLLWPWPSAAARFLHWRRALEVARDEEARLSGIAGPDLAAAILAALRLMSAKPTLSAATLACDGSFVEERIARLLQPLAPEAPAPTNGVVGVLAFAAGIPLAIGIGIEFGERLVATLLTLA